MARSAVRQPPIVVRALQNIVVTAMLALVLLGLVGWLSFVLTGAVPQLLVALGVYSAVTAELGSKMLSRISRLRL